MTRSRKDPRRVAAAAALMAAAALKCTPASAADGRFCDAYALEAIKIAKEVRDNACGFDLSHPQWSMDINVHKRWCLSAEVSSVDAERQNRRVEASICSQCRTYAQQAVRTVETAIKNACAVSGGPRWSTNEDDHYRWCAGLVHLVPSDTVFLSSATDKEAAARTDELGACLVQKASQALTTEPPKPKPIERTVGAPSIMDMPRLNDGAVNKVGAGEPNADAVTRRRAVGHKRKDVKSKTALSTNLGGRSVLVGPCKGARTPCKTKPAILTPGPLETDGGFASQGPAAAGKAAPVSPSSGGVGLR